jgi:23S rRNA-/tRNA-specific pseudouridylate synthase
MEMKPWTGRTHQLRVHSARVLGSPIVGDDIYGGAVSTKRQQRNRAGHEMDDNDDDDDDDDGGFDSPLCLHAQRLCIYHPISGAPMIFEADPPF